MLTTIFVKKGIDCTVTVHFILRMKDRRKLFDTELRQTAVE